MFPPTGLGGDITLASDDGQGLEEEGSNVFTPTPAAGQVAAVQCGNMEIPPSVVAFMAMIKPMMEGNTAAISALARSQSSATSTKRKREMEEEEEGAQDPVLIHLTNHELKDDAHAVIDWEARSLRPYNGGDWDLYWKKMPAKAVPVIEDLAMGHVTKAPINPNVIRKLHNRGEETTGKQWLSSNYAVEGKGGRIRADNDRTAGAFVLDYQEATGVWEAVDAIHNFTVALRFVRPEDHTGELMLRTMHDCRMFRAPSFSAQDQRRMIMDYFNQVLKISAMKGRMRKPPMDRNEMLDLAKQLLFAKGVEGLTSFMTLEPYSTTSMARQSSSAAKAKGVPRVGAEKAYKEMTLDEKRRKCCRAFNSSRGCPVQEGKCRFKHWCSHAAGERVCWNKSHGEAGHK